MNRERALRQFQNWLTFSILISATVLRQDLTRRSLKFSENLLTDNRVLHMVFSPIAGV